MTQPLNIYGDSLVGTTGRHGADISSQRMDDLDVEAVRYALQPTDRRGVAVDLGCGVGIQGLRFAAMGLTALLVDVIPEDMTVMRLTGVDRLFPISYLRKDARTLAAGDLVGDITLCYSQRFIHYLRFSEAVALLRLVRAGMRPDARLFLSASGLSSELGELYGGRDSTLADRFSPLSPEMAAKHEIREPVCLYTPEDLISLCGQASFRPDRVFSSPFGNIKGILVAG